MADGRWLTADGRCHPSLYRLTEEPRDTLTRTLPAPRLAKQLGADGVELDVHATRDGALIVHHDYEFPRWG
jgi:glycerophosphoryl diester phosphodiesterase